MVWCGRICQPPTLLGFRLDPIAGGTLFAALGDETRLSLREAVEFADIVSQRWDRALSRLTLVEE